MEQSRPELTLDRAVTIAGLRGLAGAVAGCFLVCLAAQVRVPTPFSDVPMTLQVLAVLLVGFALPASPAVAAMLLYLGCGAAGLPVFAAGPAAIIGPTGGYLVGFVAAAWIVSMAKGGRDAGFFRLLAAGAAGLAVVFAFGVGWRVVWFGGDLSFAVATGFTPFAAKAVVEVLLAVTGAVVLRGRRDRRSAAGMV